MHSNNLHRDSYNFDALVKTHAHLKDHVFENSFGNLTIDFSSDEAVFHLNKALLAYHYGVSKWTLPKGYLCPAIPGRVDYIHHVADLLKTQLGIENEAVKGLDIGVGANCIYPILGSAMYDWNMVGVDSKEEAIASATENVAANKLSEKIEIRHQTDNANIFQGIIHDAEHFHFSMCNPPFHSSAEEALRGSSRKEKNLHGANRKLIKLNFGGQANELWCNGGEALFIKRMIKQSVSFRSQVDWFTTLVSKKDSLPKIYKQLDKLGVQHTTINMEQGHKKSRIVAWKF